MLWVTLESHLSAVCIVHLPPWDRSGEILCSVRCPAASRNVPKPCCVLLVPNVLKMTQAAQTVTRKAIPLDQEPVISNLKATALQVGGRDPLRTVPEL